jgi:hypothetical protein
VAGTLRRGPSRLHGEREILVIRLWVLRHGFMGYELVMLHSTASYYYRYGYASESRVLEYRYKMVVMRRDIHFFFHGIHSEKFVHVLFYSSLLLLSIRVIAQSHPKPRDGFGDLRETVRKMTSVAFSGSMSLF